MTQILFLILGIITFGMGLVGSVNALSMLPVLLPFEKVFLKTGIPGLNLLTVILLPLCVTYILKARRSYAVPGINWKFTTPVLGLMVVTTVAALHPLFGGAAPEYSLAGQLVFLKRWFTYFLLFFIFFQGARDGAMVRNAFLCIAIGYCLESLHTLKELVTIGRGRLYGSLGNPNELGAYLACFWPVVWISTGFQHRHRWLPVFLKGGMAAGILCALRTLSRGSYLTLLVTGMVFVFFKSKRLFVAGAALLLLVVAFYQVFLPQFMVQRIGETFEQNEEYYGGEELVLQRESAGARILFWKAGLKMFAAHPVLGVGFHQFRDWLPHYGAEYGLTEPRPPHNMYIKMLAEQGVPGFGIFLLLLWRAWQAGLLLQRSQDAADQAMGRAHCTVIAGLCVAMLFGDRFFFGALVGNFFILSGVVWSRLEQLAAPAPEVAN